MAASAISTYLAGSTTPVRFGGRLATGGGTPPPVDPPPFGEPASLPVPGSAGQVKSFWFAQTGRGGSINDPGLQMIPAKAQGAYIAADGRSVTSANWDENGGEGHFYPGDGSTPGTGFNFQDTHPDTGPACTIDAAAGKAWLSSQGHVTGGGAFTGIRRYALSRSNDEGRVATGSIPFGIAVIGSTVYVACADSTMRTYNKSTLAAGATWAIGATPRINCLIAVDGKLAVITGAAPPATADVRIFNTAGSLQGTISGLTDPRGLGIDNRTGTERLVVCLGENDHRLAVYDAGTRTLVDYFGVQGGMYSTAGGKQRGSAVDKNRLVYPRAARIFADGSWQALCNMNSRPDQVDSAGSGIILRRLPSKAATTATWNLDGLAFCDGAQIDPTTGVDAFTVNDWFKIDQATGAWTHYAHTLDLDSNPSDPRPAANGDHSSVQTWIFYVSGQRFMATMGMYGEPCRLFKQVGQTFVHTGQSAVASYTRGVQITPTGTIWSTDGNSKVTRRVVTGVDGNGNPIVGAATNWPKPAEWNAGGNDGALKRAFFDETSGAMYVAGHSSSYTAVTRETEKIAGNGMARYNNFLSAGFTQRAWMVPLPTADTGGDLRGIKSQAGFTIAGDYVFTVEMAAMEVRAWRKSDGGLAKEWIPGSSPAVAWSSEAQYRSQFGTNVYRNGWSETGQPGVGVLDVTNGLHAYRASNGVYVLSLYDNGAQKIMWMQWTP